MADFRAQAGIQEEKRFTNPQVRFRRIRGRIVPIFNKKRIGQDISKLGEKSIKFGAIVAGASLVKRTKVFKSVASKTSKFSIKTPFFNISKGDSIRRKVFKKSANLASKSLKFGLKHSGKLGLLGIGAGIAIKITGDITQARSAFGKDLFQD